MKTPTFPGFLKKFTPLVYTLAILLTLLVGFVGYSTSKNIQGIITHQFNEQQLVLARKISDHIQDQMFHLQTSLLEVKKIGELERPSIITRPQGSLSRYQRLLTGDLLAVLIQDERGKTQEKIQIPDWNPKEIPLPNPRFLAQYLGATPFPYQVWVGNTFSLDNKWVLPIGVTWQKKGAVFFILDAVHIARKATHRVVSGTTGYAWIINRDGILLDHTENDFIGRSIFWVLKTTSPGLSVKKLNDLVREDLLQKKEGTSTYILGWHRSRKTATEKLIAYTPILFYETPLFNHSSPLVPSSEFWSVAVVAPTDEVAGLVRNLNRRQAILVGIFQLCIIIGTGFWVFLSNRWSRFLKIEIKNKTEELKKYQEKLIHSERLAVVGSMASHVSHEIKNPLIAIGGLAHQLKRSPSLGEKEKQKLETITTEINRLEKILLEVRDFSRPTTPHKIKAQVNKVLLDLGTLFSPLFAERHIKVETQFDPDLPDFFFDPEQIKQVLINLIKNALEAMTEGGTLTLVTEGEKDSVLIRISDTGKGIDSAIREQLFRPFVTSKEKGTGLGLAVSYKLIQDHNGDILVESSGKGTTMTVRLPILEK